MLTCLLPHDKISFVARNILPFIHICPLQFLFKIIEITMATCKTSFLPYSIEQRIYLTDLYVALFKIIVYVFQIKNIHAR